MARTKINVSNQLSVNANLKPDSDDGFSLGTTAHQWSDAFLASGAVLNFNNGDVTMTHGSNLLTISGGTFATAALTSTTITASGIIKTDDSTQATTALDGSLQTDGGLSVVKDIIAGNDVKLLSDAAVFAMGAGSDITITHDNGTGGTLASAGAFVIDGAAAVTVDSDAALVLGGASINVDADGGTLALDGTGGVSLGTATSGVAVTIGHGTSEVTIGDNLTVSGDLTVSGTTTTVNSTVTTLADPLIVLAQGASGSPANDLGLVLKRGSSNSMGIIFDESDDTFKVADIGSEDGTTAGNISQVTPTKFMAGQIFIDSSSDYIDVVTDLKVVAAADIVLDPGGANVVPGGDSEDSLGRPATSASHSEGSQTLSTSGLTSSQSISMSASGNHAVLFGSSLSAPSASSAASGFTSALQAVSQSLSGFSSTFNGTLSMGSYSGSTISAGSIFSLNGSSSSFYFVVTSDYSSGSSISVCAMPNVSGHSTSIGSISSVSSYSSSGFSGSGALSGVSTSAGETVSFTLSGGSAVFVSVVGPSSSTPWGFVGDPRDDVSTAGTFSGTPTAAKAGGSITAAASAVAWANLYVDAIDLNGQGIISVGGVGAAGQVGIDLDADGDTSIRASADDVITFEVGGADLVDIKAAGLQITDDKKLMFGAESGGDASFEYDEDGNNVLLYAGASMRFSDDVKLEFGAAGDASIEYDEDGTDQLRIAAPSAGVVISGTTPKLVLGDAGAEDTMLVFDGNAQDFRIGLDDGTDILELGVGAAHGTTTSLKLDASLNVDVAGHDGSTVGLKLAGTIVSATAAELNHLDGIADAAYDQTADSVAFFDATDSKIKYEGANDFATAISGDGLSAASGKIKITAYEQHFNSSSLAAGAHTPAHHATASLNLESAIVSNSLEVYLNGMLQMKSGSIADHPGDSYDYKVDGVHVQLRDLMDSNDVLVVKYLAK